MSHQSSLINNQKNHEPIKGFCKRKTVMGNYYQEIHHARKEAVVLKLLRGRESARKLKEIIHNYPAEQLLAASPSTEELVLQILRSFTESLNEIKSCTGLAEGEEISAVDCAGESSTGGSKKVNDGRGCYKRRKNTDSWSTVSPTMEDCYAWRKYGQKRINSSEFPRCYYRCTHGKAEGCTALKQVQRIQNGPVDLYRITYIHGHTCKDTLTATAQHLLVGPELLDPNLISFGQANNNINNNNGGTVTGIIPTNVKQEDSRSTADIPWDEIVGFDALGPYDPAGIMGTSSGFGSSGSTCLNDIGGIEVDDDDGRLW